MNLIKEACSLLGIGIGEQFRLKGFNEIYRINGIGEIEFFKNNKAFIASNVLSINHLLNGSYTIEKLPWRPQDEEEYYYIQRINNDILITGKNRFNQNELSSLIDYYSGNCFQTREEALKNKEKLLEKLKNFYNNNFLKKNNNE